MVKEPQRPVFRFFTIPEGIGRAVLNSPAQIAAEPKFNFLILILSLNTVNSAKSNIVPSLLFNQKKMLIL
jgi:hypothetical protein